RLCNRRQFHRAVRPFATLALSQQRRERQVDHHHRADMRVKAARSVDLAVIDAPKNLEPTVHALHRRATIVEPLKLLGRSGNTREATEVDLLFDTHRQAVAALAVANGVAGAGEALMPRRTTILQRAAFRFVADVRHRVSYGRFAYLVIAEHGARLIVDDV